MIIPRCFVDYFITNKFLLLCKYLCIHWDPVNRFNHTSWVAIVTPTDRPNSVCNRCVTKVFDDVFVLSHCFLDISVGAGAFVKGHRQIFSFCSCIIV